METKKLPTDQGIAQSNNQPTNECINQSNRLFVDLFPTTELAINLKLLLRTPRRLAIGEMVPGVITHDGDDHFSFLESDVARKTEAVKRNPCIMQGKYINVHRKDDGTLYPTFCRPTYTPELTFGDFCRKAAEELLTVAGFVGK